TTSRHVDMPRAVRSCVPLVRGTSDRRSSRYPSPSGRTAEGGALNLPLKGGGRSPKAARWGFLSPRAQLRRARTDPHLARSGRPQRQLAEVAIARAVEADEEETALAQRGERAGEVLHRDDRHEFERARGGLGEHAGRLRAVARGGDDRLDREARGGAQDRPHI